MWVGLATRLAFTGYPIPVPSADEWSPTPTLTSMLRRGAALSEPSTRPPKVGRQVTGGRKLGRPHVEKKLGANAFAVWLALVWRRDKHGVSFAKLKTIAEITTLSRGQTKRALEKLRGVDLVETLGWKENGCGAKQARRVRGDYRDGVITVTAAIEKKLSALGRGGARKPKQVATGQRAARYEESSKACRSQSKACRSRGHSVPLSCITTHEKPSSAAGLQLSCNHPRGIKRVSEIPSEGTSVPSESISPPGGGPRFELGWGAFEQLDIPLDCDEPPLLRRLLEPGGPLVPPCVTTKMMATPRVPPPPLLDLAIDDASAAHWLARYFRGAVISRTGEPCYILCRCDLKASRYYRPLVAAAVVFREQEIAPAAWAAFSCDVWRSYSAKRRKVPPINWVFAAGRIEERLGWFRREEGSYRGGRLLFSEEQAELLRRVEAVTRLMLPALRKEVAAGRRPTAGLLASVGCDLLDEWLPGGFDDWLIRARRAGERDAERIRLMVDQGEFVW